MDDQTYHDENEYVMVMYNDIWNLAQVPGAAYLVDHVLGGVPSGFVGHGRVEVGAAAEEESGEGDEGEGLENGPGVLQSFHLLFPAKQLVEHAYRGACQNDKTPNKEQVKYGLGHINAQHFEQNSDYEQEQGAHIDVPAFPEAVKQHADAIQAAPNHEIPRSSVPQSA